MLYVTTEKTNPHKKEKDMDNPEQLGQKKSVTIEQDEQGNVMLWKGDLTSPFALTTDEAIDLLYWLYDRRDELHQSAYPQQEGIEPLRTLPEWARKPKGTLLSSEPAEYKTEPSKPEDTEPS